MEAEGGGWDEESPTTYAKYPGEVRVCAGAAMRTAIDLVIPERQ